MIHAVLLAGAISLFGRRAWFYWELAASCVFIYALVWLALEIRKDIAIHRNRETESTALKEVAGPLLGMRKAARIGKRAGLLVLGVILGWSAHASLTHTIYFQERAAYQLRVMKWQQDFAVWSARQPKENK